MGRFSLFGAICQPQVTQMDMENTCENRRSVIGQKYFIWQIPIMPDYPAMRGFCVLQKTFGELPHLRLFWAAGKTPGQSRIF
jgi:hypothetical protein